MSSVTTLLQSHSTASFPATAFTHTCQKCGAHLSQPHTAVAEDAQRRISELEAQVKILTGKATAAGTLPFLSFSCLSPTAFVIMTPSTTNEVFAEDNRDHLHPDLLTLPIVDKLADYEDELRQLKSSQGDQTLGLPPQSPIRPASAPGNNPNRQHLSSRFSNLLTSSRRTTSQLPGATPDQQGPNGHIPTNSADLLTLLTKEQTLRQAAESRVSQTNEELEELSAQLFTEANEMVAAERKARAKLEERVAILEGRDKEKRNRLELLESRLGRIERVRGLLSKDQES